LERNGSLDARKALAEESWNDSRMAVMILYEHLI
jgi:hypothetical protein